MTDQIEATAWPMGATVNITLDMILEAMNGPGEVCPDGVTRWLICTVPRGARILVAGASTVQAIFEVSYDAQENDAGGDQSDCGDAAQEVDPEAPRVGC